MNRRRTSRVLSEIEEDTENESIQMRKMESVAKEPGGRGKVFEVSFTKAFNLKANLRGTKRCFFEFFFS